MRKKRRTYLFAAALAVTSLLAAACGGGDSGSSETTESASTSEASSSGESSAAAEPKDGPEITVGSVNFAENRILAQIYTQALEANGFPVDIKENIGAREVVAPALANGDLDFVVEYTGNALRFEQQGEETDLREPGEVYEALAEALAEKDLVAFEEAEAQDVDGLAVTRETADSAGLEKISDIAEFEGTFRFGGGPECTERISCLEGYRTIYGFTEEQMEFVSLDVAGPISIEALKSGEVDGANLFTTQGVIAAEDFVLLEDDMMMQLPQNIVPVTRKEIADAYGSELADLVNEISGMLTTENLTELNAKVEIDQEDPADVAKTWLEENGLL